MQALYVIEFLPGNYPIGKENLSGHFRRAAVVNAKQVRIFSERGSSIMPPKRQMRGNRNISPLFSFGPQVRCFWFSWGIGADCFFPPMPQEKILHMAAGFSFMVSMRRTFQPVLWVVELQVLREEKVEFGRLY
jgi:hypothetical protein